eukprot:354058-Chlamydomonas_euryale.AAC.3
MSQLEKVSLLARLPPPPPPLPGFPGVPPASGSHLPDRNCGMSRLAKVVLAGRLCRTLIDRIMLMWRASVIWRIAESEPARVWGGVGAGARRVRGCVTAVERMAGCNEGATPTVVKGPRRLHKIRRKKTLCVARAPHCLRQRVQRRRARVAIGEFAVVAAVRLQVTDARDALGHVLVAQPDVLRLQVPVRDALRGVGAVWGRGGGSTSLRQMFSSFGSRSLTPCGPGMRGRGPEM